MLGKRGLLWGFVLGSILISIVFVSTSSASIVFESKGWRITMPSWAEPGSGAAIIEDPTDNDEVLMIEIFKVFKGSVGDNLDMPSIVMTFTQIGDFSNTASKIIINDESISNHMAVDWTGFDMMLVSPGLAKFNGEQMFGGPNSLYLDQFESVVVGREISPLTNNFIVTKLSFRDGIVPAGDDFTPGSFSGAIVIDPYFRDAGPAVFKLKEIPSIPEPASLALLSSGAVLMLRRRRMR